MIAILSHRDSDGRFSSFAAWDYFRQQKQLDLLVFHEVQYGQPFPLNVEELTKDDEVYILDFSYKREVLDPVFDRVGKLVVLDHHETAVDYLKDASYGVFDMSKSGALLAWEYFFPNDEPPLACMLVNDRDLWQFKLEPHTSAFEAWLHFDRVGQDWEKWHALSTNQAMMKQALDTGLTIVKHNASIIKSFTGNPENICFNIRRFEQLIDGVKVYSDRLKFAIYNGNQILTSELAQSIYTHHDVALTIDWRCRGDIVTFSVRSPNVAVISAKQFAAYYGGGGHPAAAGFSLPRKEAFELIDDLMQ